MLGLGAELCFAMLQNAQAERVHERRLIGGSAEFRLLAWMAVVVPDDIRQPHRLFLQHLRHERPPTHVADDFYDRAVGEAPRVAWSSDMCIHSPQGGWTQCAALTGATSQPRTRSGRWGPLSCKGQLVRGETPRHRICFLLGVADLPIA